MTGFGLTRREIGGNGWTAGRQHFGNRLPAGLQKKVFTQIFRRCTQMHADETRLNELSGRVIGGAFTVLNALGVGFLEKVYQNEGSESIG